MGYTSNFPSRIGFIFRPRQSKCDDGDDNNERPRPCCNELRKKSDGKLDRRKRCSLTVPFSSSSSSVSSLSLSSSPSSSSPASFSFSRSSSSSSIFSRTLSMFSRSSPSSLSRSPSSSSSATDEKQLHHGHGCIERWREELRPLLNSIRSAVISAEVQMEAKELNGSDCNAIGPLRISHKYHHDAWHNAILSSFASSNTCWSLCRYLSHAEDTIIVYWLKHCPEAMKRRDFEVLTRVHNGGPQAIHETKTTNSYWRQVSKYLELEMAKIQKESFLFDATPIEKKHSKKDEPARCKACELLSFSPSLVNANTIWMDKTLRNGYKFPQILKPKLFRCSRSAFNGKLKENIYSEGDIQWTSNMSKEWPLYDSCESGHKTHNSINYFDQSKDELECKHVRRTRASDYWVLSEVNVKKKAAVKIQAFWRMQYVRGSYKRLQTAVLLIQKTWRQHFRVCSLSPDRLTQARSRNADMIVTPSPRGKHSQEYTDLSPCKLLYRADISPRQEDALLTELAKLLKCDTMKSPEVSCHSFEFPQSGKNDDNGISTPKLMKHECSWPSAITSLDKSVGIRESFNTSYIRETPLAIKEALLSPFTEKEIINELARLFPRRLDLTSCDDLIPEVSDCFQYEEAETTNGVHCEKDEGIRELTGCSAGDESSDDVMSLSAWHCLETDCVNNSNEEEQEEDFIASSVTCCEDENIHQEVENGLVSSLSEWNRFLLFAEEKQGKKFDVDIETSACQKFQGHNVLKEYSGCSMKSSFCKSKSNIIRSHLQKVKVIDKASKLHLDYILDSNV